MTVSARTRISFIFLSLLAAPLIGSTEPASAVAPPLTLVDPPGTERDAIELPGRIENPVSEAWEEYDIAAWARFEFGTTPTANDAPSRTELWVRNVSRPTLEVFLPAQGKSNGSAMIVAPGGGFMQLAIEREGFAVARSLNKHGISAFVLKYRLAPMPADVKGFFQSFADASRQLHERMTHIPQGTSMLESFSDPQRKAITMAQEDALDAIRYVRSHAAKWNLSPHRIGIIGFSAGAVAAISAVLSADASNRPDLIASIYSGPADVLRIPPTAPPAFIAAASDDSLTFNSLAIYNSWRTAGLPTELHVFESGGHGFGVLQQQTSSDQWQEIFYRWLSEHGFGK